MLRAEAIGTRRQPFAVEHVIERGDQVGRRIHKRAVEIEDDGVRRGHDPSATGLAV
ncbi:hypothetical protein ACVWWR_006390 [Bradyrhizobium sp. LM3.2]